MSTPDRGPDGASVRIALIGALDTKGPEYAYLRELLSRRGAEVCVIDVGILDEATIPTDHDRREVAALGGSDLEKLRSRGDRGLAVAAMAAGARRLVADQVATGQLQAVLAVGGSNAAFVMAEVCSDLPVGFPKLLVSTIAAGDTRPYVREADLTLSYPVVDINGLNRLTRPVLANAAHACFGMARGRTTGSEVGGVDLPLVGVSMFGVTTAAGRVAAEELTRRHLEPLTFHCTGTGGTTMEHLVSTGMLSAVVDLTTTELADDLVGGVCTAGPDRLTAAAAAGIPQVVSVGALDMVNFGTADSVPERFRGRRLHAHNPAVTLMRTSAEECAELGARMAAKLNHSHGPAAVLFPHGGLSQLSTPGEPFHDPRADAALFETLRDGLRSDIALIEFDTDINDPALATEAARMVGSWLTDTHPAPVDPHHSDMNPNDINDGLTKETT